MITMKTLARLKYILIVFCFFALNYHYYHYSSSIMFIWGFTKSKQLETLHLKFCKTLLGVRRSSCNVAIYGELGRYPLYINIYIRIVKYCYKICKSEHLIIKTIVDSSISDAEINN